MVIQNLKKKSWSLVHEAVYVLSKMIPKDKNTWVFGSWQGNLFSDNTKYLFLYVISNHPEINAVWITKDKKIFSEMQKDGYNCCYYNSLRGIKVSLKASVAFTTTGMGDVAEWASAKIKHISLWHGTPLKRIGQDNDRWRKTLEKKPSKIKTMKEKLFPYAHRDTSNDVYIVASEETKKHYITAFHAAPENVYVAGQPRNDVFIRPYKNGYFERLKENNPEKKIICYMPTHRIFGTVNNNPITAEVMIETDKFLRAHNIILIMKPHVHEMKNFAHLAGDFTNIILGLDKEVFSDPYSFLPYCDLLISDYSSVYVDFMCSGEPVVLFPYDLDYYLSTDAGLYYKYEDIAPGPICYKWDDVLNECIRELNIGTVTEKYKKIQKMFNEYNDGLNCERTYNIAVSLLNKN